MVVPGGATRQESVLAGLVASDEELPYVAIHDGARPLIDVDHIERCLAAVHEDAAIAGAILATRATDTLKVVDDAGNIVVTAERSSIWCAQTPQCFRREAILSAHEAALLAGYSGTDDASLIEWHGGTVRVVEGPHDNMKVTYPEDLGIVEAILASRMGIL
jgi:2-C-methyl-D-erythritol 4-phosphate cytidylyltransferase